jgi:hypothetical protein
MSNPGKKGILVVKYLFYDLRNGCFVKKNNTKAFLLVTVYFNNNIPVPWWKNTQLKGGLCNEGSG